MKREGGRMKTDNGADGAELTTGWYALGERERDLFEGAMGFTLPDAIGDQAADWDRGAVLELLGEREATCGDALACLEEAREAGARTVRDVATVKVPGRDEDGNVVDVGLCTDSLDEALGGLDRDPGQSIEAAIRDVTRDELACGEAGLYIEARGREAAGD